LNGNEGEKMEINSDRHKNRKEMKIENEKNG